MTLPSPPVQADDRVQLARELVMTYGWNATAYQLVNPGISLWFAAGRDAVVGYVQAGRTRVIAGAPVCDAARLPPVVAELEAACAAAGQRVLYFCAEARLEGVLRDSPSHSRVLLGAQPAWDPRGWEATVASRASLRAQLNRARNKGVVIEERAGPGAGEDPALRRVLGEWLATRGLPPLHFLVEPETLGRLFDRRLFVARRGGGAVVGFLVASPVPTRNGWLVEQIVRGNGAPNGTNELLVDAVTRAVAAEGATYITLGLSPLSRHVNVPRDEPFWLRLVLGWVRAHGRRFYNFEGLDRFKAKFAPERWEPVYAIYDRPHITPRALRAIAQAFTGGAPELTVLRAVLRAARMELRWARERRAHRRNR